MQKSKMGSTNAASIVKSVQMELISTVQVNYYTLAEENENILYTGCLWILAKLFSMVEKNDRFSFPS